MKESKHQAQQKCQKCYKWPCQCMPHQDLPPHKSPIFDQFYNIRNLISPFNDVLTLEEVHKTLQIMKEHGTIHQQFKQRFLAFQQNLNGVLQRKLIENSSEKQQASYQAILAQLNRKLIVQQAKKNNLQNKVKSLQEQLFEKDNVLYKLQKQLDGYRERDYNNQILVDLYKNLVKMREQKPPNYQNFFKDLDKQLKQYDHKFKLFKDSVTRDKSNKILQPKIKSAMISYVEKLDQLRNSNILNVEHLKDATVSFLTALQNGIMRQQFQKCINVYHMKKQISVIFSVLEEYLKKVRLDEVGFKQRFDQLYENFARLRQNSYRNNEFFEFKGWVQNPISNRTIIEPYSDENNKLFLSALGVEMKRILERYPKIRQEVDGVIFDIINLDFISQAVQSQSLIRIKQIVHKNPFCVRVQDVYKYDSSEQRKKTFHLRILIKALLQELMRFKGQIEAKKIGGLDIQLDSAVLEMIRGQIIDGVDVQSIYALFRPLPKVVQVENIVQRITPQTKQFKKHFPIKVQEAKVVETNVQRGIQIRKEVPVTMEKIVQVPISQPFIIENTKQIPVIVTDILPVEVQKVAISKNHGEMMQEVLVKNPEIKEVQVQFNKQVLGERQVPKQIIKQIPVHNNEPFEVYGQRQVPLWRGVQTIEVIKQIAITKTQLVQVPKYNEIRVIEQKPIFIEKIKPVQCNIEKPIITQIERLVQVPCKHEVICQKIIERDAQPKYIDVHVPIDKQIPKELLVQSCDYVVGQTQIKWQDPIEIIRQVPYVVEKMMTVKDIIKEPVIQTIIEQKCVPIEVSVPYRVPQPFPIRNQIFYPVPVNVEIPVQVVKQIPVPIYIDNVIVNNVTTYIDRPVKEIVQVPVIHQVQKIVEKIVVVPTIVRQIIDYPVFIEKIVEIPVQVLHISRITEKIPEICHVDRIVPSRQLHIVQVPMQVPGKQIYIQKLIVEKQIETIVQVKTLDNYINQQVRVQVPVQYIREVIVQKPVQVPYDRIRTKEVCVPFKDYQIAMQQKPVPIHQKIYQPYPVHLKVEKIVPVYTYEERIHEVIKEKIVVIKEEHPVQCLKQILVRQEVVKEVPVRVEKIVPVLHIIEDTQIQYLHDTKPEPFPFNEAVYINTQVPMDKPVQIPVREQIPLQTTQTFCYQGAAHRTIIQNRLWDMIKIVQLQAKKNEFVGYETKIQTVQAPSQQIVKEVVVQKPIYLNQQVPIQREIVKVEKIPGPPKIVIDELVEEKLVEKQIYKEKIYEKIILLQEVHQVVKTIHEIAEVRNPDSGVQIDSMRQLHIDLQKLLVRFDEMKNGQVPKNILILIQDYMKQIGRWIQSNPKVISAIKEIQSKINPVVIQSRDNNRQIALTTIIKQLVSALSANRNKLEIPRQIQWLFMYELNAENLANDQDFMKYFQDIKHTWQNLKHWKSNHLVMLHSFLSQRLAYGDLLGRVKQNWDHSDEVFKGLLQQNNKFQIQYFTLLQAYEDLYQMAANHKCRDFKQSFDRHKKYGDGDTDLGDGDNGDGFDGDEGGFPGGGGSAFRRSRRIIQSRYTGLSSGMKSRQYGNLGGQMVKSELYDPSKFQLLKSRYSIMQKDRSALQMRCQQLQKGLLQSKHILQGLDADGKNNNQAEIIRSQLMNTIQSLENDNRKLRQDYQQLQSKKLGSNQSATQSLIQRNKRQITDQYERKIKNMQQAHKRQLQKQRNEHQIALKKSQNSNIKAPSNIQVVKKQLTDDFDRRLKRIEEQHQNQINKMRSQHQAALRQSQTQSAGKSKENQLQRQNKKLGDQIKILQLQILSLRQQLENPQYQVVQHSITRTYEQPQTKIATVTGRSGSKKFERSGIEKEVSKSPFQSKKFQRQEERSSSSREGSQSFEGLKHFKPTMTLKVFSDGIPPQELITTVMLKVIDAFQDENDKQIYNCYSPTNIYIKSFNVSSLESMFIKFGAPILNKKNRKDGCYIAPQVHAGSQISSKSIVFSLGVIWDELIHKQLFFSTIAQIENPQVHYQVRNGQISPIIKNLLVDMLTKDVEQRLQLPAVRKRLALQKYVSGSNK